MKLKFFLFLTLSTYILFSGNISWCQTEPFIGRLIDSETKKPISNAKITVEGEEFSTYSNVLGFFQVSGSNKNIKITHVGYQHVLTELREDTPKFFIAMARERHLLQALEFDELTPVKDKHERILSIEEEIEKRLFKNSQADLKASFPEGLKTFHDYLINNMYNNKDSLSESFNVEVLFTINELGELRVDSMEGMTKSPEIIRSIFENSPNWVPALQKGLAVPTYFQQEISLDPFSKIEPALPIGGMKSFYDYIHAQPSFKYPREAQRSGIEGIVYIQLDIEADGSLANVIVLEGIGGGCGEVLVKVIKNSPKWKPAKKDGIGIRSQRVIPFRFVLGY